MIKNFGLKVNVDSRGKIKSGKKSDKGLPQSLSYFNVDKFDELKTQYGEQPKELFIVFPTNRIEDFFDHNFVLYGGKTGGESVLKRSCDGDTCTHRVAEKVGGEDFEAGEITPCVCKTLADDDKARCRYYCYFKAFIINPKTGQIENPNPYLFETGSSNSGRSILSEINKTLNLTGGNLIGIPFKIMVKMVGKTNDAKMKFPIWNLETYGMMSDIRKISERVLTSGMGENLLLTDGNEPEAEVIETVQASVEENKGELFQDQLLKSKVVLVSELKKLKTSKSDYEAWRKDNSVSVNSLSPNDKTEVVNLYKELYDLGLPF